MISKITAIVLLLFFLQLLVRCFFVKKKRKEIPKNELVSLPFPLFVIGVIGTAFSLAVILIVAFTSDMLGVLIAFTLFYMLGTALMLGWKNCCILYNDTEFIQKTFFGIKRRFTYDQITAIEQPGGSGDIHLCANGKRVLIDEITIGGNKFLSFAKKKYRTIYNGRLIPISTKTRFDIFNGHVKNPYEFIVVYGVLLVLFSTAAIFASYVILKPTSESNTIFYTQSFSSYTETENDLVLRPVDDSDKYVITDYKECVDNPDRLFALCDGKTEFKIYASHYESDNGPYYEVWNLAANEEAFVTFSKVNEVSRKEGIKIVVFIDAIILTFFLFVIMSIVVGRNPQKFSKRFVRMFFKEGYISYKN